MEVGEAGTLEQAEELLAVGRARQRDLGGDDPPHRQVGERLLHRLHAATGARLHDRVDLLDLRLPDQVADGVVGHEDLQRRGAAAPVGGRDEVLRDDSLERRGELHAHLLLLRRGRRR